MDCNKAMKIKVFQTYPKFQFTHFVIHSQAMETSAVEQLLFCLLRFTAAKLGPCMKIDSSVFKVFMVSMLPACAV